MSAALTLIMPAWNAEKYIERSVRSVLDQSWRDLRLLVVDDGSTDGTAAILKRLAEADPRLTPMSAAGPKARKRTAVSRPISPVPRNRTRLPRTERTGRSRRHPRRLTISPYSI